MTTCGNFFDDLTQFAQWFFGVDHDAQYLQRADDAVARRGVITKDHVPGLFAADVEFLAEHRLQHVAIADGGARHQHHKECGSTYPRSSVKPFATTELLGNFTDGDGTVCMCDESGVLVDGDDVLAITALDACRAAHCQKKTLVSPPS